MSEPLEQLFVKQLETLEARLTARLDRIEALLTRLDTHVDLVETVYDKVKAPLEFVTNRFNNLNWFNSSTPAALPGIQTATTFQNASDDDCHDDEVD